MNSENKRFSEFLVTISFIIFSVVIPFVQIKIDYWERQREIYTQNLFNAEFQRVVGVLAANIYETISMVKESKLINDPEAVKIVEKIRNLYLNKTREAATNMQFLQTEPVNNDERPSRERYNEIKRKIYEKSPEIEKEADIFLTNFNKTYQEGLAFWKNVKIGAYILATIAYLWSFWLGIGIKRENNDELVKNVRELISRVNTLIKKKQ